MTEYGNYPAFDIEYDTTGQLVDPAAETELVTWLTSAAGKPTTDLVVMSHGWNNDMSEARQLYADFFASVAAVHASYKVAQNRTFAVAAVLWPSKRFADADLIAGGAAALPPDPTQQLNTQLDQLKLAFAANPTSAKSIEDARAQIPKLNGSQAAQDAFVSALASAVPHASGPKDEGMDESMNEVKAGSMPGHTVLARLGSPVLPVFSLAASSASGHALGLGNVLSDVTSAASRLANLFTYYTMKDRAGVVGSTGVLQTVLRVQASAPAVRVHLVGHSFGGRLVTATANAITTPDSIASLLLLEAAYSHNGLAKNWDGMNDDGSFRSVVAVPKIGGPTLISHSVHDTAVGLAYPLASRIMQQVASAVVGGPTDKFGGMGRNGAQNTPEAFDDVLLPVGTAYVDMPAGKTIRNLNGDGPAPKPTILNHGDVAKPELAWAWLSSL